MAQLTRFQYDKRKQSDKKLLLSVCVFLLVLLLFYLGFTSVSQNTDRRQRESLERALNRNVVHYYAVEGHYPETLNELVSSYGLIYDRERFYVDYRLQGANIFPDITIIDMQEVE